jgi:hypothetical protein
LKWPGKILGGQRRETAIAGKSQSRDEYRTFQKGQAAHAPNEHEQSGQFDGANLAQQGNIPAAKIKEISEVKQTANWYSVLIVLRPQIGETHMTVGPHQGSHYFPVIPEGNWAVAFNDQPHRVSGGKNAKE